QAAQPDEESSRPVTDHQALHRLRREGRRGGGGKSLREVAVPRVMSGRSTIKRRPRSFACLFPIREVRALFRGRTSRSRSFDPYNEIGCPPLCACGLVCLPYFFASPDARCRLPSPAGHNAFDLKRPRSTSARLAA